MERSLAHCSPGSGASATPAWRAARLRGQLVVQLRGRGQRRQRRQHRHGSAAKRSLSSTKAVHDALARLADALRVARLAVVVAGRVVVRGPVAAARLGSMAQRGAARRARRQLALAPAAAPPRAALAAAPHGPARACAPGQRPGEGVLVLSSSTGVRPCAACGLIRRHAHAGCSAVMRGFGAGGSRAAEGLHESVASSHACTVSVPAASARSKWPAAWCLNGQAAAKVPLTGRTKRYSCLKAAGAGVRESSMMRSCSHCAGCERPVALASLRWRRRAVQIVALAPV